MKTSQNGINFIKSLEGCITTAYLDENIGLYKIGYDHSGKDVFNGLTVSEEQADDVLRKDLAKLEKYVNDPSYVKHKLNQNQFDALVSFTLNQGQKNLKELCANKTLSAIANDFLLYNKSGRQNKVLEHLVKRREAEQKLFLSGSYSLPSKPFYQPKNVDNISSTPIGDFTLHTNSILEKTGKNFSFSLGDYNHDCHLDLYCIKSIGEPECTEVHILSGKNDCKSWLLQTKTPIREGEADWAYCLGDYNNDGNLDLFCIRKNKTGTNSTEVHILSGKSKFQKFLLQTGTVLHETDQNNQFCVGDFNGNGNKDLFFIAKNNNGSHSTEVHILNGSNNYQSWSLQTGTILHETDDNWEFGVSDYNGKGKKDLYCIKKKAGNCTEVHILDGSHNYQAWSMQTATKLHQTDENFCFYPVDKQVFAISRQGASNSTEIHALRV
jgi:GH24 family phage-related lysozyme (muramidase)